MGIMDDGGVEDMRPAASHRRWSHLPRLLVGLTSFLLFTRHPPSSLPVGTAFWTVRIPAPLFCFLFLLLSLPSSSASISSSIIHRRSPSPLPSPHPRPDSIYFLLAVTTPWSFYYSTKLHSPCGLTRCKSSTGYDKWFHPPGPFFSNRS
ncbi:hypothetical protein P170DRAFT_436159 [Aspergillus steynii IBT 23096]|uniref:Uncharacterized protein n=1 Tax=Aspergillus steynii IBT 23096 TaxID=1392250 RepID=A0A2I2GDX3_9EURO|nr:uncharacterized protein P170DRAFT_436159 [Aspergillus steynii IBT 23096]PLB51085.1 hypothetical protein P170DRAFT_436159 [Aspergillus steynii IBT 23096]